MFADPASGINEEVDPLVVKAFRSAPGIRDEPKLEAKVNEGGIGKHGKAQKVKESGREDGVRRIPDRAVAGIVAVRIACRKDGDRLRRICRRKDRADKTKCKQKGEQHLAQWISPLGKTYAPGSLIM